MSLVKEAAAKLSTRKERKFTLRWDEGYDYKKAHGNAKDTIYPMLAKLLEAFTNKKEFAVEIDGQKFTVNPIPFNFYDLELKNDLIRTYCKDYASPTSDSVG